MQLVTHFTYVRNRRRCREIVSRYSYNACNCRHSSLNVGPCNMCHGKRSITRIIEVVVNNKCVKRRIPKYEACAKCFENPRSENECLRNTVLKTTTYFNKLNGCFKCVQSKRTHNSVIQCKNSIQVNIANKCEKHTTQFLRRPVNCKCFTEIKKRVEFICCPPSKILRSICRKKQLFHRTRTHRLIHGRCVPEYKETVENIKCRPRRNKQSPRCERERNGKFFCQATGSYEIEIVDKNCKCQTKTIKFSRVCCCKKPVIRTSCQKELGIRTKTIISYRLTRLGRKLVCLKSETKTSSKITFQPAYSTKPVSIGTNKRIEAVYVTKRVGCDVKTMFVRNDTKIICCQPQTKTEENCIFNNIVTTIFEMVVRNNVCVKVTKSRNERKIKCPPSKVVTSQCVEGKVTQITTSFFIRQCKCRSQEIKRIIPCKCRPVLIRKQDLACNKYTCKKLTIYYFQNASCAYYKKICLDTCCCPKPDILPPRCDPTSGNLKVSYTNYTFVEKNSTCLSQTTMKTINTICNKNQKIRQSCNKERKYFRKIVTLTFRLSRQQCKCKQITSVSWECCSVPPPQVIRECRGSSMSMKTTTYKCSRDKSQLISESKVLVKPIRCPSITENKQIETISRCKYKTCSYYYVIKSCKCEKQKRCEIFFKCCDEQIKTVNCLDGTKSLTTITDFILSKDKRQCLSRTQKNWKTITCDTYEKTSKTKCIDSKYQLITEIFRVRNCECRKVNQIDRKKICKCPDDKISEVCLGKVKRISIIKYTLVNDEKCPSNILDKYENIVCKSPIIQEGSCDPLTNKKLVTKIYYDTVNCRCLQKKLLTYLLCPCPKKEDKYDRIPLQSKCTEMVRVYRWSRSKKIKDTCDWQLVTTYKDYICCPVKPIKIICVAHKIRRTIIEKYTRKLISSLFPYHQCIRSVQIIDKAVECNKDYSYNERCLDGVQMRVDCKFIKRKCNCIQRCTKVATKPWNCCKESFCKKECRKNREYLTCFTFKPDRIKCVEFKTEKILPRQCETRRRVQCTDANIYKNNGYYKSCEITYFVYRNCKCQRISKTEEVLVRCRKPIPQVICRENRKVIIQSNFIINKNKCQIKKTEQFVNIDCPPYTISRRDKLRSIEYTLIHYQIRRCLCTKSKIIRFTPKCLRPATNRTCKNNKLISTIISYKQQITGLKLFPEVNNDLLVIRCQKIEKIEVHPVTCSFRNVTIETCMVKENKLRIVHEYYIPIMCRCTKRIIVTNHNSCKVCRPAVTTMGPCVPKNPFIRGYQRETTMKWQITRDNKCRHSKSTSLKICRCERNTMSENCKNGTLIHKITSYSLPNCLPAYKITLRPSPCYNKGRENKWVVFKISRCRYPGQFTVEHLERFEFNSSNCQCKRVTKSVKIAICCRPCQYTTQCLNNKVVNTRICQRPRKLICQTIVNKTSKSIKCPKPIHEVVGNCQSSPIRIRLTTFVSEKCQCIKKTSFYPQYKRNQTRQCLGNKWKITIFDYELIGKKCVERPPRIVFDSVLCITMVNIVDKKINKCTFLRSYFVKRVSKCKCVDRLRNKEILNYECCQKPKVKKECLNHRIRLITTVTFNLMNFRCFPVETIRRIPIDCSNILRERRKRTGTCTFTLIKYDIQYVNCRCKTKIISQKENLNDCCHHLKPYKRYKCDAVRGVHHTINITFSLQMFTCKKVEEIISKPINCETRIQDCVRKSTPCRNETQTISISCNKRKGCKCEKTKVKKYNICCGIRTNYSWTVRRPCIATRGHFYQNIETYVLKLSTPKHLCVATKIGEKSVICRCRDSYTIQKCLNDIYNVIIRISYFKDVLKNGCVKIRKERRTIVSGCAKNTTVVIGIVKDTKKPGWGIKTCLTTYPKNCKCEQLKTTVSIITYCKEAYPNRINKYCKQNYIMVQETYEARCSENSVIWIKKETFTPLFKSGHVYRRKGPCFRFLDKYALEARYDTWLRDIIKNCTISQTIVRTSLMHCKCRNSHRDVKCLGSKRMFTDYSYIITKGRCQQVKKVLVIDVKCPLKPIVVKSKCKNNTYQLSIFRYQNINCQCIRKCSVCKICDCVCPRNSIIRKCSKNYLIDVIITKYSKKYCKCVKNTTIVKKSPECPKLIGVQTGKCELRGIHQYRKITVQSYHKIPNQCRCEVKTTIKYKICKCNSLKERRTRCFSPNKVIEIWAWVLNRQRNNCNKIVKSSQSIVTVCPRPTEQRICDYRLQKGKLIRISYYIKDCKCFPTRNEKTISCLCKNDVLVRNGTCNEELSCRRISVYRHFEARGDRCVPIYLKRISTCCCPPNQKLKICKDNIFINLNTSYTFVNESCIKKVVKHKTAIECSKTVTTVSKKCDASGFKIINYYMEKVRNCKCVREIFRTKVCACQCRPDQSTVTCDLNRKLKTNVTVKYSVSNCKCIPKEFVNKVNVFCPQNSVSVSQCQREPNRNHTVVITTRIEYRLNKDCQCKKIVTKTKKLCCPPHMTVQRYCDKSANMIVITTTRAVIRNCLCVKQSFIQKIPINCNEKWISIGRRTCQPVKPYGIIIKSFMKMVPDKCRCRPVRKTQLCNCFCSGPPSSTVCQNEAIYSYKHTYSFVKCKCKRLVQLINIKNVKCNKLPPKYGACFQDKNLCVRNKEHQDVYSIGCKCTKKVRLERIPCTTCPLTPELTTRKCNRISNFFIITNTKWWISPDGVIRKDVVEKSEPVSCSVGEICRNISRCNDVTLTELMDCETRTLNNCQCSSRRERKTGICKCKGREEKEGPCKNELKTITIISHNLVRLPNGMKKCEKQISYQQRCCCPPPNSIGVLHCLDNKLTRITRKCTYDKKMKTCNTVFSRSDETPTCLPSVQTESTVFNQTTNMTTVTTIIKALINCKCNISRKVESHICTCPEEKVVTSCLNDILETWTHTFVLENGKYKEVITKTKKLNKCNTSRKQMLKCNKKTCKQIERTISYDKEDCECKESIKDTEVDCCCPERKETPEKCVPGNILRKAVEWYELDRIKWKCVRFQKNDDKEIKCMVKPIVHRSECTHIHNGGVYTKITTTTESKKNCACIRRVDTNYNICRCVEKSENTVCDNNQYLTKVIFYKQSKSNGPFDYICERKEKTIRSNPKPCPPTTKVLKTCAGKVKIYTETFYTIKDCQCLRNEREIMVSDSECDTKSCFEIPDDVECLKFNNAIGCSSGFAISTCPITCKICEPCKKGERDCEENKYGKIEWARKL